jgi:TolA-binding protein
VLSRPILLGLLISFGAYSTLPAQSPTTSPLSVLRSVPRTRIEATPSPAATPVSAAVPAAAAGTPPASLPPETRTGPASAYDLENQSAPAPSPTQPMATMAPSDPFGMQDFPPASVEPAETRRPGAARRFLGRLNPFARENESQQQQPAPAALTLRPAVPMQGEPTPFPAGAAIPGSTGPSLIDVPGLVPGGLPGSVTPAYPNRTLIEDAAPRQATPMPSPTLQAGLPLPQSREDDFKMPNPDVEPNPVLIQNFTEAVQLGRDGRQAEAAARFQSYAQNHPLSGLTPRALYLAAVLHPDLRQAAASAVQLRRQHSSSIYIRMVTNRRPEVFEVSPAPAMVAVQTDPTPTPVSAFGLPPTEGESPAIPAGSPTPITIVLPPKYPVPNPALSPVPTVVATPVPTTVETLRVVPGATVALSSAAPKTSVTITDSIPRVSAASRSASIPSTESGPVAAESELNAALNTPREPGVRIQVARGLIQNGQAKRALELLAPAEQQVQGTMAQAEVLALQAEAYIATGSNPDASRVLASLIQNFPDSSGHPRIRLQLGLLSEEAGVVQRARSYYRAIIEDSPTSPEAAIARSRMEDLRGL